MNTQSSELHIYQKLQICVNKKFNYEEDNITQDSFNWKPLPFAALVIWLTNLLCLRLSNHHNIITRWDYTWIKTMILLSCPGKTASKCSKKKKKSFWIWTCHFWITYPEISISSSLGSNHSTVTYHYAFDKKLHEAMPFLKQHPKIHFI